MIKSSNTDTNKKEIQNIIVTSLLKFFPKYILSSNQYKLKMSELL